MFHAALRRCALVLTLATIALALPASANAAARTWVGPMTGQVWSDPVNWDGGATTPQPGDTVDLGGANVLVLAAVDVMSVANGSLDIQTNSFRSTVLALGGGTATVNGSGQVDGTTTLTSGTLVLDATTPLDNAGPLTVGAGATVRQTESLTVTDARDLAVAGQWILEGNGTFLEDDANADMTIDATGTLVGEPSDGGTVHSLITLTNG